MSREIMQHITADAKAYHAQGITPQLAIITATADAQTQWYVRSICRTAARCHIKTRLIDLGPQATTAKVTAALKTEAQDPLVHGLLLQTPLPPAVQLDELL